MTSRPLDSTGDILPVLSPEDILKDAQAAAVALRDHLRLYKGDWWENTEKGNGIIDLISISRKTAKDASTIVTYLISYILTLPGISSVSDASSSFSGHVFVFKCVVHTEKGGITEVSINFEA